MVTYDNAGLKPLKVGSNKTLIGLGDKAGIQGAGLFIGDGAHNVIVRNLTLSDINPRVVWGGDALTFAFDANADDPAITFAFSASRNWSSSFMPSQSTTTGR